VSASALAIAVSVSLLIAAGCGRAGAQPKLGEVAQTSARGFRVLDSGDRSGITSAQERVVRDAEGWRRLWQEHEAGGPGNRSLHAVDFSRQVCIAIFAGQRPTGGFTVTVEKATESASGLEVAYRVTGPPPGAIVSQALTSPFQIVAVESRAAPVRFQRLPDR
jgi:hypothetical protein